jgi:hypothetical protein
MKYIQRLEMDFVVIMQGIAGLTILVLCGITLAEGALNDLTKHADHIQFLGLQMQQTGTYTFYFFGKGVRLSGLVELGKISSTQRLLLIELGGHTFALNTRPTFEVHNVFQLLGTWMLVFKQGAFTLAQDTMLWLWNSLLTLTSLLGKGFALIWEKVRSFSNSF